ncbi:MAG: DUF2793 domain-containing protein [Novosphingobium sp.]|nr:DUF2793 domain-containing protein [Novosphingobium sp.]
MTDPFLFDSTTPRFGLPLLHAGQSQKEAFVNEAHALADALLHGAIEGELATPPASPDEGECWLVGSGASGAWAGHDGAIACRQGGNWLFVPPRDGLRLLDRSTGQDLRFFGIWQIPSLPPEPTGGSTVDSEARTTLSALLGTLRTAGIFPAA